MFPRSRVGTRIEVADGSLDGDCGEKAQLYASGGIADYWVFNIPGRCVEAFCDPQNGHYASRKTHRFGERITPPAFPDVALDVAVLFTAPLQN